MNNVVRCARTVRTRVPRRKEKKMLLIGDLMIVSPPMHHLFYALKSESPQSVFWMTTPAEWECMHDVDWTIRDTLAVLVTRHLKCTRENVVSQHDFFQLMEDAMQLHTFLVGSKEAPGWMLRLVDRLSRIGVIDDRVADAAMTFMLKHPAICVAWVLSLIDDLVLYAELNRSQHALTNTWNTHKSAVRRLLIADDDTAGMMLELIDALSLMPVVLIPSGRQLRRYVIRRPWTTIHLVRAYLIPFLAAAYNAQSK